MVDYWVAVLAQMFAAGSGWGLGYLIVRRMKMRQVEESL